MTNYENIIDINLLAQYDSKIKDYVDKKSVPSGTIYKYMGSINTYDDLPTNAEIGHVYNVISENGQNYAWTETGWDSLGSTIDLSVYALKTELIGKKTPEGGEIFNNYNNNKASKPYAHAEGNTTQANATESHTEGYGTRTYGDHAHAEGGQSIANGKDSHAEGQRTVAFAEGSHAEGASSKWLNYDNLVSGKDAAGMLAAWESEKRNFVASTGSYSHAEGRNTLSHGTGSHAEGGQTLANAAFAHAEGELTTVTGRAGHAEGNGTTASAPQAHAEGYQTVASGNNSHTEGADTHATVKNAHAEGQSTLADGENSHAEGASSQATNSNSHAEGQGSIASGEHAHAEGDHSEAASNQTHAEGYYTRATASAAHSEGRETLAQGVSSHAEGAYNKSLGGSSHTEGGHARTDDQQTRRGGGNIAMGGSAHAEGITTRAGSEFEHLGAHAEGGYTQALAPYAHAEGCGYVSEVSAGKFVFNTIEGESQTNMALCVPSEGEPDLQIGQIIILQSITDPDRQYDVVIEAVDGDSPTTTVATFNMRFECGSEYQYYSVTPNIASGKASHAAGICTIASAEAQTVVGKFNKRDRTALFIVGNGLSDDLRHNVFTVHDGYACIGSERILTEDSLYLRGERYSEVAQEYHPTAPASISFNLNRTTNDLGEHFDSPSVELTGYALNFNGEPVALKKDIFSSAKLIKLSEFENDIGYSTIGKQIDNGGEVFNDYSYNKATGFRSHAEGSQTQAINDNTHAEGFRTTASGLNAHAEGGATTASGDNSHAEGNQTTASGKYAHAAGWQTEASGNYSYAHGIRAKATGKNTYALGADTQATADHAVAMGNETIASGIESIALGYQTRAIGKHSIASGSFTKASGDSSHAEGQGGVKTLATLNSVYFEDEDKDGIFYYTYNYTSDEELDYFGSILGSVSLLEIINESTHILVEPYDHSFSGGMAGFDFRVNAKLDPTVPYTVNLLSTCYTSATGVASHASGISVNATADAQVVFGKYNEVNNDALFIVGNGTSDTDRSNAFVVKEDGTAYLNNVKVATVNDIGEDIDTSNLVKAYVENNIGDNTTITTDVSNMGEAKITLTSVAPVTDGPSSIEIRSGSNSNVTISSLNVNVEGSNFTFNGSEIITLNNLLTYINQVVPAAEGGSF